MSAEAVVDPERLAALIDGRLTPDERKEVLEQLAASPELASLYADAVAAHAQTQRQSWWLQHRSRLALAASLLIVVTGALWYQAVTSSPSDPILVYAEPLTRGGGLPGGWDERPWSDVRGDVVVSPIGRAARFGVLSVDLQVAMGARDTNVVRLAREIAALMADVPASAPLVSLYQQVSGRAQTAAFEDKLLDQARRGALAVLDTEIVEVTAWAEAALIQSTYTDSPYDAPAGVIRLVERLTTRQDLPADALNLLSRVGASLQASQRALPAILVDLRVLLSTLTR